MSGTDRFVRCLSMKNAKNTVLKIAAMPVLLLPKSIATPELIGTHDRDQICRPRPAIPKAFGFSVLFAQIGVRFKRMDFKKMRA